MTASDGYGPRTGGQKAWLAGAVGLVAVLVVGGGWLVWQGAARPVTVTGGDVVAVPDAALPLPTTGPVGFGAPRLVDGVPWGFELTPDGAVAAGLAAVAATGQPQVVFDPARFDQVANVVFTPQLAAVQARQVDAARTEFELSGYMSQPASRRLYFFAPLAARLDDYRPDPPSATVQVWAVTLVGVGDAGGAVFTTTTLQLTADPDTGTWRVATVDTVEGPTPLVDDTASAPGRTRQLLRDATPTMPVPLPSTPGGSS